MHRQRSVRTEVTGTAQCFAGEVRGFPARRAGLLAAAIFAVAACGGASVSSTPSATASIAASAGPTARPATPAPVRTPASTPLPALTLLWQQGGPAPSQPSTWAPAIDPLTGDIWVSAGADSHFWIFSPDGKYLESWGAPGKGDGQFDFSDHQPNPVYAGSVAFAPDGSFFVSDVGNHRVEKFDKNRNYVTKWGSFGSGDGQFAQNLEIVTDGKTVYVGDGTRSDIQAFDTDGHFLRALGADHGYSVFLALDASGNLYATNPDTPHASSVGKYDPTGKLLEAFDLAFAHAEPVGVAVAANGHIFVSFNTRAAVPTGTYELDPTGKPIRGWSTAGESLLLAPDGKALYMALQGVPGGWGYIRKYALP